MAAKVYSVSVTAAGGAGTSTGTGTIAVQAGLIDGIYIFYGSAPATTDVTITEEINGASRAIITVSNTGTSGTYKPFIQVVDAAAAGIASQYAPQLLVGGAFKIAVAQANNGSVVTVFIVVRD